MNPETNDTVPQPDHSPTSAPDVDLAAVCEDMRASGTWALLVGILVLLSVLGVAAAEVADLGRELLPLERQSLASDLAIVLLVSVPYLALGLGVVVAVVLMLRFGLAARRVAGSAHDAWPSLAVAVRRQHQLWKWGGLSLILGVIGMVALTPLVWGALMLYGLSR